MKRLTEKHYLGTDHYMKCSDNCNVDMDCIDCPSFDRLVERLAAYEDTGLEPESVEALKLSMMGKAISEITEFDGLPIDRIRDLARADKDGRLVVLPCKVGDTVYWAHGAVITECKVHRIQKNRNGLYICLKSKKSHGAFRTDLCFGKSIFLTREEAEKTLEATKNGN